jgi:hypothetical protein
LATKKGEVSPIDQSIETDPLVPISVKIPASLDRYIDTLYHEYKRQGTAIYSREEYTGRMIVKYLSAFKKPDKKLTPAPGDIGVQFV